MLSPLGVYRSVMPPWRDAGNLGAQLFTTDALHGSGRVTIYVEHAHFGLIVCYNWQCMHSFCPLDRAIFKALRTHCSLHAGHSSDCTGELACASSSTSVEARVPRRDSRGSRQDLSVSRPHVHGRSSFDQSVTLELVYVKHFPSILAVPEVSSISAATSILVLYRGLGNFRLGIDLSMPSLPHVNPKPMCLPGKPHEIELFSLAYACAGLPFPSVCL